MQPSTVKKILIYVKHIRLSRNQLRCFIEYLKLLLEHVLWRFCRLRTANRLITCYTCNKYMCAEAVHLHVSRKLTTDVIWVRFYSTKFHHRKSHIARQVLEHLLYTPVLYKYLQWHTYRIHKYNQIKQLYYCRCTVCFVQSVGIKIPASGTCRLEIFSFAAFLWNSYTNSVHETGCSKERAAFTCTELCMFNTYLLTFLLSQALLCYAILCFPMLCYVSFTLVVIALYCPCNLNPRLSPCRHPHYSIYLVVYVSSCIHI